MSATKQRVDLKELTVRFLQDRRIASLNNQVAALYNVSIPIGINYDHRLVYEPKVEIEVNKLRSIIADIIRSEYSTLVMQSHDQ